MFSPDPQLAAQVFPPTHRNPVPAARYNLVVIGGGTAGLVCAAGAAGLGAKVALVERRALGGDCLNVGCVPSKAFIRAAHAAHAVREAARFGVHATIDRVDFAAVMARVRAVRQSISPHDSVARFAGLGVDVFLGDARFTGRDTVEVGGAALRLARGVIATGARPKMPDVPGLADARPHTNETIFEIEAQPRRLLVIGGGPIGCELGQAFQRLGTQVTLVQSNPTLLARESADAAATVHAALLADGVAVYTRSRILRIDAGAAPDGAHRVHVHGDAGAAVVDVDAVLVAAGRQPNVEGLGLEAAGVAWTDRGITVDAHLRTSNPAIYAAGDVCLPQAFTHAADASARAVIQNALFLGRKGIDTSAIPRCTYTDPEVAHVGETSGPGLVTHEVAWTDVDRARTDDERQGGVRLHARDGRVVGGTVVGRGAGDLIGEVAVLVATRTTLSQLAAIVHPYPTRAEAFRKIGDLHNRGRLTPTVRGLFDRWLAWRR
ncbi:mercuric reductase [Luteitalea sp. TBR-22]|uniref:FAD-dependent oxidoreductase n=1 Tax=Luteitalea sp. TBR-22 TaxID=2802971 RepID=UPI001AF075F1|nr:FAD-dependent oxidoreductase [Luteitalea sp. TBR-22]BCS31239.1 mercuric reductase [Luteitalea sp. TBR-22]